MSWPLPTAWNGTKSPSNLTSKLEQSVLFTFPSQLMLVFLITLANTYASRSWEILYISPQHREFERQRFLFRSREDGKVMVVDIEADTTEVGSEHVYIYDASRSQSNQSKKRWTPAQLTRFAARVLYAPQRLRLSSNGLTKVSLPNEAISLIKHERIQVRPYASWKTQQGLFVTVLILTNPTNQPIELHPLSLRGRWIAATFHHYRLLPITTNANVTALYLISDQPFTQALDL